MQVSAILAMAQNGVIGKNNTLPWHLPADLAHFKALTLGNAIIMGRQTYTSIGKALPGRLNIIVTRDEKFTAPGCIITHSPQEALKAASACPKVFVIGGAQLLQQMLPSISCFYLTLIHHDILGDTYFKLDRQHWQEIERKDHHPDIKNHYSYSFLTLIPKPQAKT